MALSVKWVSVTLKMVHEFRTFLSFILFIKFSVNRIIVILYVTRSIVLRYVLPTGYLRAGKITGNLLTGEFDVLKSNLNSD